MPKSSNNPRQLLQCVCQICTCGRHRCPHNRGTLGTEPVPLHSKCTLSEYQSRYEGETQPVRPPLPPKERDRLANAAMSDTTTYGKNFVAYEPQAKFVKKSRRYTPPKQSMVTSSTYQKEFFVKDRQNAPSFKPVHKYEKSSTPFCKESGYTAEYGKGRLRDWKSGREEPIRQPSSLKILDVKFTDDTTTKRDYIGHEQYLRRPPILPKSAPSLGKAKVSDVTSYKADFIEKEAEEPAWKKEQVEYQPSTVPFKHTSITKDDFVSREYQPVRKSFKPLQEYKRKDVPMASSTTIKDAYRAFPFEEAPRAAWSLPKRFTPPKTAFTKSSSYQDNFLEPGKTQKVQLFVPSGAGPNLIADSQAKILDRSQYREQFIQYDAGIPDSFKKIETFKPPTQPMTSDTLYKSQYKGESQKPRGLLIPPVQTRLPSVGLQKNTIYMDDYHGKKNFDCPAKILADNIKDVKKDTIHLQRIGTYRGKGVDCAGHYIFADINTKVKPVSFSEQVPSSSTDSNYNGKATSQPVPVQCSC